MAIQRKTYAEKVIKRLRLMVARGKITAAQADEIHARLARNVKDVQDWDARAEQRRLRQERCLLGTCPLDCPCRSRKVAAND